MYSLLLSCVSVVNEHSIKVKCTWRLYKKEENNNICSTLGKNKKLKMAMMNTRGNNLYLTSKFKAVH